MVQSMFGGETSYKIQSLKDIQDDIDRWIQYTTETKAFVIRQKSIVEESGFWDNIEYNFLAIVYKTICYFETILYDLDLVKKSIEQNCITEKEVNLLNKIGIEAMRFNRDYGRTYKENTSWHDCGNPDFIKIEKIYKEGRDFFITMQDAANAAKRLKDYMGKGQIINNSLNIQGSISASQIQQGTIKSDQEMEVVNSFDYNIVSDTLKKIKRATLNKDFDIDFGEQSLQVKQIIDEIIKMVEIKEEPTKIKGRFSMLKDLAFGASSGIIANGIYGLITQLPIW